jgi:dethiobiotin synthetase/adenosylmethionine--8-amino-7-oxononanoate aminotransferase
VGQGWADRVFYSDNGSTGTEVALKMALRAAGRRYGWDGERGSEVGVIGLRGGYHGDTVSRGRLLMLINLDRVHGRDGSLYI